MLNNVTSSCWMLCLVAVGFAATHTARGKAVADLPKKEPLIRVGIVLPEDGDTRLDLNLEKGKLYRLKGKDSEKRIVADGATTLTATLSGDHVVLEVSSTPPVTVSGNPVVIEPAFEQSLEKGAGILVRHLVAGRGFHWSKRIDQTLLGSLQVHPRESGLVLVNELPVEWYLAGVLTGEMSGACPLEFMKAQTVAARSWFFAGGEGKHAPLPFDRCNDDCCQRYQGTEDLSERSIRAITETRGEVVATADGNVCNTNYSKSCGGIMADPSLVWGSKPAGQHTAPDAPEGSAAARFFPVTEANVREYLTGDWVKATDIFCSAKVVPEEELGKYLGRVDETQKYFRWEVKYTRKEVEELLRAKAGIEDLAALKGIEPGIRGPSGRLHSLVISYLDAADAAKTSTIKGQYNIRKALHPSFLYSSAFVIDTIPGADGFPVEYVLRGGGWGHGAGLCQIGALGMGLKGYSYEKILVHYFENTRIAKAYP